MSFDSHHPATAPGHDDHHDHAPTGHHGSYRSYLTGFVLAVGLTVIPFALVMLGVFPDKMTAAFVILGLGAVQMLVHLKYFLHLDRKAEGGMNFVSILFTVLIVVIILAGSIWVMHNMNAHMMPKMDHGTAAQPHSGHSGHGQHGQLTPHDAAALP